MAHGKIGKGRTGPSHMKYNSENRLKANKIRRITKCNGLGFLEKWKKSYA